MKGYTIKKLRKEKGLTQEELAKALNISKSTVGMLESDRRDGSRELLNKLSDFFNVSLDYLEGKVSRSSNKFYDEKKSLVSDLLEYLVDINAIDDINNLSKEIEEAILNTVKAEISLIISRQKK